MKNIIPSLFVWLVLFQLSSHSKTIQEYEQLSPLERKSIFTSKNNLPEEEPDKLLSILIYGLNDSDVSVVFEAMRMSVLTISGLQARQEAGTPVPLDPTIYNDFLMAFIHLDKKEEPEIKSFLEDTRMLELDIFKELTNENDNSTVKSSNPDRFLNREDNKLLDNPKDIQNFDVKQYDSKNEDQEKPASFPLWLLGIVGLIAVLGFLLLKGRSK